MKVLLLNYTDAGGGAAIAAARLTQALRNAGVDATLGVVEKRTTLPFVQTLTPTTKISTIKRKIASNADRWYSRFHSTTNPILHSINYFSLVDVDTINKSDYDVVHLHWVNYNTLSIRDIGRITKPTLWTMHDSWVFCGAEHHPHVLENDERYREGYMRRNKPVSTHGLDVCRWVHWRKRRHWSGKPFYFISPSHFEKESLQASVLFPNTPCDVIPNIIDQTVFCSKDSSVIRSLLDISPHHRVIGCGAAEDIGAKKTIKGGRFLLEALQHLQNKDQYQLLIFGKVNQDFVDATGIGTFCAGHIDNSAILTMLYNCCDVFVCPSVIENLPYTCLESLACGVPVTAFRVGGIPDVVEHQQTGYLAHPYDPRDLANGIDYCIKHRETLSQQSLEKAQREFDEQQLVQRHIELYRSVLDAR